MTRIQAVLQQGLISENHRCPRTEPGTRMHPARRHRSHGQLSFSWEI